MVIFLTVRLSAFDAGDECDALGSPEPCAR
jgi:hypothetical protein